MTWLVTVLRRFVGGVAAGTGWSIGLGLPLLYLAVAFGQLQATLPGQAVITHWIGFAWQSLHWSLLAFAAVLLLYVQAMSRLRALLDQPEAEISLVAHYEHLIDIATGLFFGVGVVWTAIGMESALINALSDPDEIARGGAFELLQRLVDGGILLALSTTVVGGIGGYLLRLFKTLTVAQRLQVLYSSAALAPSTAIINRLDAIEALMRRWQAPTHTG